jgi:UDP-GlcNAc:undecaprenyl-phosphate/decaprenyl-phosphate GlcNAc-1-phosphate transferase
LGSSLIAFLVVNLNLTFGMVGKVFLGDAGTALIGFFLCWYLIKLTGPGVDVFNQITAVWLIALPIMDTLAVMIRRIRSKQSPFRPGRDHIHHLLLRAGFSSFKVLVILIGISTIFAGIGILGEIMKVPELFMFLAILIFFALYLIITQKLNQNIQLKSDIR